MEIPAGLPNEIRIVIEELEKKLRWFTQADLDMDGRRVINMGRAVNVKDAVTLSQLKESIDTAKRDLRVEINTVRKGI